jgi:thymidine phosphorylase
MIAGRGLGHTGGTVDKLNAIPGMNMELSTTQCDKQMTDLGGFFLGQTKDIAALDRELYRLRDVTATIESIPLILVSILSKKLAEGLNGLVMDVKFGSGAFMSNFEDAEKLAQGLVDVAGKCGLSLRAVLSDMNSPLGSYAGNSLEVWECLEIMKGGGPEDTIDLTLELTAQMIQISKPNESIEQIKTRLRGYFNDGSCYEMFSKVVSRQGGDISFFDKKENFYNAKIIEPVYAQSELSFVDSIDVRSLGLCVVALGGGRKKVTDEINPRVGLSQLLKVGSRIESKTPLAYIHADSRDDFEQAKKMVLEAYTFGETAKKMPLIGKILS